MHQPMQPPLAVLFSSLLNSFTWLLESTVILNEQAGLGQLSGNRNRRSTKPPAGIGEVLRMKRLLAIVTVVFEAGALSFP